jgi:peptidyl-prolyl cis-trans isomerase D
MKPVNSEAHLTFWFAIHPLLTLLTRYSSEFQALFHNLLITNLTPIFAACLKTGYKIMSIIQRIRDKAAWLIFGAIALAMIGFIVTDAFHGRGGGWFNSNSTTMGKVNGKKIDYVKFAERMKAWEAQAGGAVNDALRQNMQDNLWNQMVEEALMKDVYDDLGLFVTDKEISDILYGQNPPEQLRRQFVNEAGQYDPNAAFQAIQQLQKRSPQEYEAFVESLIAMRQREKYISLLANTTYIPKWMLEKASADASQMANISYVNIPYSTVTDSSVTVSDQDIKDFISKRPDEFKQEESRSIAYVAFNAAPSAVDSNATRQQLQNLKPEFDSTTDVQAFLARNGSEGNFADAFVTKSNMHMPNADSIESLPIGGVFGPYLDAGNYVMAKMIDKRSMPDTVKVRHILMSTQNGQPDSVAKRRIDSVAAVIAAGADFKTVAAQVSEDPGVKQNGGDYELTSVSFTNWAKEFAETGFFGKVGDKKVVKTSFGWHYIEVLEQKKIEPAYKVAYFTKSIVPSTETDNVASGLANQFAGQSRDLKSFDANVAKNKYAKIISPEIKPTDMAVPNLGSNRQFVRWIYDADLGDVSEPYRVEDKYVVAVVTEINKEGLMTPAKARPIVEVILRNKKKAAQIIQKLGKPATLEAAASAANQMIQRSDSLSFASPVIPNVGQEAKVIGAAFNKSWQGKVTPPIGGNGGVFVLRTETIFARANPNADVEQQRNMMMMQQRSSISYRAIEAMKKAATIKDNRGKFL